MQYVANLMRADIDAATWAKDREADGWDGVAITDVIGEAVPVDVRSIEPKF